MSTNKEDEKKVCEQLLELIANDATCERLNAVLLDIAIRRDPTLFKATTADNANKTSAISNPPPRFEDDEKNVLLYIERNKNKNVVVYRGMLSDANTVGKDKDTKKNGPIDEDAAIVSNTLLKYNDKEPLDAYWLDIDPAYMAANRKKGITTNRCELNMIDRNMAYGVTVHTNKPVESIMTVLGGNGGNKPSNVSALNPIVDARVLPVSFVAIGARTFFMALTKIETRSAARPVVYLPVIFAVIGGKVCVAERIYVQAKEGGMFSLPKVEHVDLVGWEVPSATTNVASAVAVNERITP